MGADGVEKVRLEFFGGFGVKASFLSDQNLINQKSIGLLAIIAASPGLSASRDRIAGLLWSTRENELARNSLRQTLAVLRRNLGDRGADLLHCGRTAIKLNDLASECDVADFIACIRAGQHDRAVALYTGPFLDGVFIRDPAFEDWYAEERRRLAGMYLEALETLVHGDSGARRVHLARKLVNSDILRESSHNLLIDALAQMGERDEALRQIRSLEEILQRELGVGLSPETAAMKRALLRAPARRVGAATSPNIATPASPVLAIHPFACLSDDAAQQAFAKGLGNSIITTLSKLPYLRVMTFATSGANRARPEDLAALDRANATDYVLEGSLMSQGEKTRFTIHLIDSRTDAYVFSQRYDFSLTEVFAAQDEITLKVAVAINVALLQGDQALSKVCASNRLEPWEHILQASTLISSHDRACSPAARRSIAEAIRLDPGYSAAHTLMGWWHWAQAFCAWTNDPSASVAAALDCAVTANRLDPTNPEPHVVMAIAHMQAREFERAEEALGHARHLGQSHAMVHAVAANVAMFAGRPIEALALTRQAIRLCPVYPPWYAGDMAQAHLQLGQLGPAMEWAQAAIDRSAGYIHAHLFRIIALYEKGLADEAAATARTVLHLDPAFDAAAWAEAQPFHDRSINQRFFRALSAAGLPDRSSRVTLPGRS
ncbi:BTAD domain-containing putative transcriptional regulator [Tabrizicola sp. BL-A-41-H6]|uniref:BTAD domain-containing putative transcriptional regulator n=1 Tax=Tabrizicola sp. BL-A-41-H6 TaxID=3421107 RepID=UPI003D66F1BA